MLFIVLNFIMKCLSILFNFNYYKTNTMKKKQLFSLLAVATLFFAACNDDLDNTPPATVSALLTATASPDAPKVNVYINGIGIAQSMPYGMFTPYVQVYSGITNIRLVPEGGSQPVIDTSINAMPGSMYSVFAIDSFAHIKATVVKDSLQSISSDSVYIRFFHFSPNTPAVNIAISGGDVISPNRSFNDQASVLQKQQFTKMKAGTYTFEIQQASPLEPIQTVTLPPYTFIGGSNYTLFIKGFNGASDEKALGMGYIRHN